MKGGPRNWVAVHAHLRGGAGNHGDDRKDGSRLRCRVRIEWNDEDEDEDEDAGTDGHHDGHHDPHHDGDHDANHDTLDRHVHLQHAVDMHAVDGLLTSEHNNGEHDMPNTEFDLPFELHGHELEIWNDAFDQILSELAERQTAARTRMEQLIKERAALLEERQRLLVERERLRAKLESITADE